MTAMRLGLGAFTGVVICLLGVLLVEALHIESFGYFMVALIASVVVSLFDRERFYGIEPHK